MTKDGHKAGHLERVVIDPRSKEVTHLIVGRGFLLAEDKVVPIDWVSSTDSETVRLARNQEAVDQLPDFEQLHYIQLSEQDEQVQALEGTAEPLYWYPPLVPTSGAYAGQFEYPMAVPYPERFGVPVLDQNIPEDAVPLKEGARVVSKLGDHVGSVERVFLEPEHDHVTHLLISKGVLLKERKLIPATWIDEILEDEVRLAVGSNLIEQVPDYKEETAPA
jgi:uncharacterized protein YrrD